MRKMMQVAQIIVKKALKKDDDENRPSVLGRQKMVCESTTDRESRDAYETPTVSDRRNYMLEAEITPGNVHDSVAFDTLFERLTIYYPEVKVVTADAGYKTPWICKQIFDSERIPSLPYKQSMSKKSNRLGICMMNITTVSYTCRTRS